MGSFEDGFLLMERVENVGREFFVSLGVVAHCAFVWFVFGFGICFGD